MPPRKRGLFHATWASAGHGVCDGGSGGGRASAIADPPKPGSHFGDSGNVLPSAASELTGATFDAWYRVLRSSTQATGGGETAARRSVLAVAG